MSLNPYHSRGAPYVRAVKVYSHTMTREPRSLHWTPTKSFYVGDDGDVREIWGLLRNEAVALCRVNNVSFYDSVLRVST